MISTLTLQAALLATLKASGLFDKVMAHSDADLAAALRHLRDQPASIAVVVPGADSFDHQFGDPDSPPLRCEWRCTFDILFSGRQLDKRETGDPRTLELKDAALNLLLWADLGLQDLLVLPASCEPLALEFENGSGREAWKLSAELRLLLS